MKVGWKELYHNKWIRFIFWAVLYTLWVVWLGNYWWLFGLVVIFDLFSMGKTQLEEIAADGEDVELNCQFCSVKYKFSPQEIREIISGL